jgi:hypothetical protein
MFRALMNRYWPHTLISLDQEQLSNDKLLYVTCRDRACQQVAVFSRTWPAARRAGQCMPHKAGIDGYYISVGERQPAQQVCIAKNSFPLSRASLRTFLRKLI